MTGYDDEGYTKKDITDIIIEKEEEAKDIFDIVNYSVSDPLWQWLKIVAHERFEIEFEIDEAKRRFMNRISNQIFDGFFENEFDEETIKGTILWKVSNVLGESFYWGKHFYSS